MLHSYVTTFFRVPWMYLGNHGTHRIPRKTSPGRRPKHPISLVFPCFSVSREAAVFRVFFPCFFRVFGVFRGYPHRAKESHLRKPSSGRKRRCPTGRNGGASLPAFAWSRPGVTAPSCTLRTTRCSLHSQPLASLALADLPALGLVPCGRKPHRPAATLPHPQEQPRRPAQPLTRLRPASL